MAGSIIKETTNGLLLNWPLNGVTTPFNGRRNSAQKKKKKKTHKWLMQKGTKSEPINKKLVVWENRAPFTKANKRSHHILPETILD